MTASDAKLILVGPGGSSKDYARKLILESFDFSPSISYTTRPIRDNEKDGVDYCFLTEDKFKEHITEDFFYEWNFFANKWYYGTPKKSFDSHNLFIMTPSGIKELSIKDRNSSIIVYINPSESIRYKRLSERKDIDNVERRMETDRIDFINFGDFDVEINSSNFTLDILQDKVSAAWSSRLLLQNCK